MLFSVEDLVKICLEEKLRKKMKNCNICNLNKDLSKLKTNLNLRKILSVVHSKILNHI
jgi:hypothetical protein